jgi:spore coat polysaccharide biosynthesis predicted glycosyltransferase SpsG
MILFRTGASSEIGFGHANRCISLASLIKHRSQVRFVINKDKVLGRILKSRKIPFSHEKEKKKWENWRTKAVILDISSGERLDDDFLRQMATAQIPVIELSSKSHLQLQKGHSVTLGPKMIPIHPKFRHFHLARRNHRHVIKNVFLSLGGRTNYRMLRKTLDTLVPFSPQLKVALGPYQKNSSQKVFRRLYPNVRFVGETDNLARSLFEADVAFITTGMIAYEAATVGTPAFYIYNNSESELLADFFQKQGAGLKLCDIQKIKTCPVGEFLKLMPQEKRQIFGKKSKQMEDGKGIFRIIDFLKNEDII